MCGMKPSLAVVMAVAMSLPAGGCSVAETIQRFDLENPAPELGRSDWVRGTAGVGAWVGGVIGGVASLVLLPVTYPIRWIRGEPAANDQDLLFPVSVGAATGHFVLGAPADLVDFVFYRAWIESEAVENPGHPGPERP